MVITYSKSEDQPGKVANPARGQLNRENDFFPVPVRAREFGLARRVRQSRPVASNESEHESLTKCVTMGSTRASTGC